MVLSSLADVEPGKRKSSPTSELAGPEARNTGILWMARVTIACNFLAMAQVGICRVNHLRGASDSISESLNQGKLSHPSKSNPALCCLPVVWKLTSLLPLRGGFDVHQDLIECRTIKKLAVRDDDADFPSVPDVFERVCAQQHQIGDLAGFD
jgi:hypothetical protein